MPALKSNHRRPERAASAPRYSNVLRHTERELTAQCAACGATSTLETGPAGVAVLGFAVRDVTMDAATAAERRWDSLEQTALKSGDSADIAAANAARVAMYQAREIAMTGSADYRHISCGGRILVFGEGD